MIGGVRNPHAPRFALLAVLLAVAAGCTQVTPGVASPQDASAPTTPPGAAGASAAPSASAAPQDGGVAPGDADCQVTAGQGSISVRGGGNVVTRNGLTSFSCRGGPLVTIQAVNDGGAALSVDDAFTQILVGKSGAVGPYRITVTKVDTGKATFLVALK
jgi:hypothetical protein